MSVVLRLAALFRIGMILLAIRLHGADQADIHFPRGSRNNGTLKLQITSGRGPQAQAMSAQIIDQVNAAFGYQAVGRITLVQNLPTISPQNAAQKTGHNFGCA
jgi:hypothetical protein